MKNRTDKILLAVFLLSMALAFFLIFGWLEIIPVYSIDWPYWAQAWYIYLTLAVPAIPVFCLQLLLCRNAGRRFSILPGLVIIGAALYFTGGWLTFTPWDNLGYLILLLLCIAPAAGCILAWVVHGCQKLIKKGVS